MMLSMTAFASREKQLPEGQIQWEIKSVNHRYLEPTFKLPDTFQSLEYTLRDLLRQKIQRGKVQCNLYFEKSPYHKKIQVDLEGVDELIAASQLIKDRLKTARDISPLEILNWPAITKSPTTEIKQVAEPIQHLFEETLNDFLKERASEGLELKQVLQQRLDKMREVLSDIKERLPTLLPLYRERLLEKMRALKLQPDPNRLEQELVFMAQKMDVTEEVERLEAHIKAVATLLESSDPVGRRLDFLMQELNREANTLGAKSTDIRLSQNSIELKVCIEQMREQIQNVE